MKRPTRREMMQSLNLAHRDLGLLYDKPPMLQVEIAPKRERKARTDGPPLEREVLKAVWHYLSKHPKVAWVTRINSGGTYFDDTKGGQQFMRFNYKRGMSDIIGQMKTGQFLACECKREGVHLEPHQRDFLNEVRAANGVAFVARSVEDCIKELG